ncbi:MAG: T9SS type A sorting domain-containing protein [Ignavibacteria bacterium]|nr:T9SS type A sorting domain-containing protein [Ignavibacteria bacterium]
MKNLKLNFLQKIYLELFFILVSVFLTANISNSQWVQQTLPPDGGIILGIDFTDPGHGVIGGWTYESQPTARGYYTTNGGVNWLSSSVPDSVRAITDIQFISKETGYATGAYNFPTAGAANTSWSDHHSINGIQNKMMGMNEGINYDAILLKTTDAGMSWFTYGNPPDNYSYVYQIILIDDQRALISGADQFGIFFLPRLSKTSDGGVTWIQLNIPMQYGDFTEMIYRDDIIYAVGYLQDSTGIRGVILRSTDFGISWSKTLFDEINNFQDIKFINEHTGYVCGTDQMTGSVLYSGIYKTTNGGMNWNRLNIVFDSTFISGLCVKENSGNVMFYGNKVEFDSIAGLFWHKELKTGASWNYGNNWTVKTIRQSGTVANSQYLDSLNVFLTGAELNQSSFDPIVLHSTNGGFTSINPTTLSNPEEYTLYQNYPNPFNPVTVIRYDVKGQTSNVKLMVYNSLGKELATLVNEKQNAGSYEVKFDGSGLSSGVYFYRLEAGDFSEVKKMVLVK